MFYGCSVLKILDLSNFIITKVTNMDSMFYGCRHLSYIHLNVSHIKTTINIDNIFCLTGIFEVDSFPDNITLNCNGI